LRLRVFRRNMKAALQCGNLMSLRSLRVLGIGLFIASCVMGVAAQDSAGAKFSMSTPDRWQASGWWPTKGTPSLSEYVGPGACTKCHAEIAASQRKTPMFNAARRPSDLPRLQQRGWMSFSDESYDYIFSPDANETKISVKDKTSTVSATVGWVFGADAQTYVLKQNDVFLESRLSYYPGRGGLDITPGHKAAAPGSIAQALGDPIDHEVIRRCFGCHSTASTTSGNFDPEHAMLGVTCEACHGPGLQHVAAMQTNPDQSAAGTMLNPERLSPIDSVDFCGACHRTPVDVALFMPRHMGISSIRLQPYRLERSLCWGAGGDSRLTCMACHDPHKPLVTDSVAYDARCLKCHAGRGSTPSANLQPACKVGTKDCVSCHMPKLEIPNVHATFTDHFIRVVRPSAKFPD
jgi:Cytochrome c554 and c-prime